MTIFSSVYLLILKNKRGVVGKKGLKGDKGDPGPEGKCEVWKQLNLYNRHY